MCHKVPYSESRLQVLAHEGSSCAQQMSPFLWKFSMIYGVSVICRKPDSNDIGDDHLQGGDLKVKQDVVYLLSPIHHCCRCSLSLVLKYPSN